MDGKVRYPTPQSLPEVFMDPLSATTVKTNGVVSRVLPVPPPVKPSRLEFVVARLRSLSDADIAKLTPEKKEALKADCRFLAEEIVEAKRKGKALELALSSRILYNEIAISIKKIALELKSKVLVEDEMFRGIIVISIQLFTSAINIDPSNPKNKIAYKNRAGNYKILGDLKNAKRDLKEAIKIDPFYAYAIGDLATIYKMKGNFEGALKFYEKALKQKPNCEFISKNFTGLARKFFEEGNEPKNIKLSLLCLSVILQCQPNHQKALDLYNKIQTTVH